jgi:hypothetical protein
VRHGINSPGNEITRNGENGCIVLQPARLPQTAKSNLAKHFSGDWLQLPES